MFIVIQDGKLVTPKDGSKAKAPYFTFWVREVQSQRHFTLTGGFKYYPETKKIGYPAVAKGGGRFSNIYQTDAETREMIRTAAVDYFAMFETVGVNVQ